MKLIIQPDGTQVLEGSPQELAEFQKLSPPAAPLAPCVGYPMPCKPWWQEPPYGIGAPYYPGGITITCQGTAGDFTQHGGLRQA